MATNPDLMFSRLAQDFDDVYDWDSANILDNASSTWVPPVPQYYGEEPEPGTLAVIDQSYTGNVSPLVTATVKDDPGGEGSVITVRLDDLDGMGATADYETSFSAPYGVTHTSTYCRHPTVEVVYTRDPQEDTGHIYAYVIWSQLMLSGLYLHWDLFGARIDVPVITTGLGAGIDWGNEDDSAAFPLYETQSTYSGEPGDELQPDLALIVNGDLLLAYIKTDSSTFDFSSIMAMRLDYDPEHPGNIPVQTEPYVIAGGFAGLPTPRNIAPSIDTGVVYSINDDYRYTAVCAWFYELVNVPNHGEPSPYQILYADWDALGDDYNDSPSVLTSGEEEANALVKVDIPPFIPDLEDPEYNEAIFTWTNFDYSVTGSYPTWIKHYSNPVIQIQVAPYASGSLYEIPSTYGIAPEVACYEREEDEDQWFGLSFYEADTGGDVGAWEWDGTRINSYSFDDDYDITSQQTSLIDIAPAFWWIGVPFAGSTLCLRDPSYSDTGTPPEPIYDLFGIAKVQGNSYQTTVYVGKGSIYPN